MTPTDKKLFEKLKTELIEVKSKLRNTHMDKMNLEAQAGRLQSEIHILKRRLRGYPGEKGYPRT